ncbi:hypothetical protein ACP70R_015544 [Stipagrostis hirtigluma subsp. patula]
MKKGGTTLIALHVVTILFGALAISKAQQQAPPAIFVFGDGALDVGNNNYLEPTEASDPIRANHSYYGIDFPNSKATGRFSNGYNMADFIAKTMGFKISPPAYLSLAHATRSVNVFTGMNYASAGAGIWNITNDDGVSIHLLKQVDYFAATIAKMESKLGRNNLRKLLSKSLFLLSIGTIDLFRIWDLQESGLSDDNHQTDVNHLITSYGTAIEALYSMGARKFAVINAPPVGSTPEVAQHFNGDTLNKLAVEFNNGLKPLLAGLRFKLGGLRYSIGDFYGFSNATFTNPSAAGFVNINSACCNGHCDARVGPPPCKNRKQYWFWDQSFTTEQAAKLAAAAFYNGPVKFTLPVNFKKLVYGK